jgi:hypothetical protein
MKRVTFSDDVKKYFYEDETNCERRGTWEMDAVRFLRRIRESEKIIEPVLLKQIARRKLKFQSLIL